MPKNPSKSRPKAGDERRERVRNRGRRRAMRGVKGFEQNLKREAFVA